MMSLRRLLPVLALLCLAPSLPAALAPAAAAITPLPLGAKVPAASVQSIDGAELNLATICASKPTVLIFYRGSWCPYCNRQLAALAEIEPQLLELGYQIIAVSPDEAAGLRAMAEKNHLNYRLLSDHAMHAASAFGVAFRVDEAGVKTYAGYGIMLPPVPGEPAGRWLPVPAVYVVGADGTVRFVYTNADYKVRLASADLLAAAKGAHAR